VAESPFARKPEPRRTIQAVAAPGPTERKCPECASTDVRKVSMVFESGTKESTSVAVGMTADGDIGSAVIGGTQQSLLAQRLQPPAHPSRTATWTGLLMGVGVFIAALALMLKTDAGGATGFFLLAVVPLGVAGFGYWWVMAVKRPPYVAALAQWARSWCCMRCGQVFA
jgi:hypothetical protein